MYHALKVAVVCLPVVLFGLGREAKADTLFVAGNAPGNPIVGKLDASFGSPGFFSVPDLITGITTGPSGQVFVATATHIYDYTSDGALLRQFRVLGGGGVLGDLAFDGTGGVPTSVPEPSTAFLLVIGLFAVAAASRSLRCRAADQDTLRLSYAPRVALSSHSPASLPAPACALSQARAGH